MHDLQEKEWAMQSGDSQGLAFLSSAKLCASLFRMQRRPLPTRLGSSVDQCRTRVQKSPLSGRLSCTQVTLLQRRAANRRTAPAIPHPDKHPFPLAER